MTARNAVIARASPPAIAIVQDELQDRNQNRRTERAFQLARDDELVLERALEYFVKPDDVPQACRAKMASQLTLGKRTRRLGATWRAHEGCRAAGVVKSRNVQLKPL